MITSAAAAGAAAANAAWRGIPDHDGPAATRLIPSPRRQLSGVGSGSRSRVPSISRTQWHSAPAHEIAQPLGRHRGRFRLSVPVTEELILNPTPAGIKTYQHFPTFETCNHLRAIATEIRIPAGG